MATKRTAAPASPAPPRPPYMLIEEIRVQGYKSLVDATLHVRPLTLLAGTNSSGKSSIMQPLLLIKQTMEASYNPAGALILNGAHVQADTAGELVSKVNKVAKMSVEFFGYEITNRIRTAAGYNSLEMAYTIDEENFLLLYQKSGYGTGEENILKMKPEADDITLQLLELSQKIYPNINIAQIIKEGPFISLEFKNSEGRSVGGYLPSLPLFPVVGSLMHIPGLRGKPARAYLATYFQNQIRGTFDLYAAGTISQWQNQNNTEALTQLNNSLHRLGLTNSVSAKVKNANEIELSVNRLPAASKAKPKKADLVNIADVGIGVSQVLPILVALIAAQEGQLVYVEQPELHLHPRAQVEMAYLLAAAAKRGVRVIVETHSSLLLLTVQTLVAEGELKPEEVGLHWFARDAKGATTVTLAEIDENGAYGNWPEDFGDVELAAQSAYLNANTKRQPFKPTTYEG